MLDGAQQVGAGHGVVHDQRHAVGMGHVGQRADVGHVAQRVADGFAEHRLRALVDQLAEAGRVARVGEAHLQALLREGVGEQVVGAAVERAGAHDVVARLGNRLDGIGDGRHARGHGHGGDAALQRCDPLFQHVGRGVHDARVDVARHLQVEQVGAVLRVVEGIGDGLVDRHRHRPGGWFGRVAGVDGEGFEAHRGLPVGLGRWGDGSSREWVGSVAHGRCGRAVRGLRILTPALTSRRRSP